MAEKTINDEMNIPDYAIERIARCLLPAMQAFFESEEASVNMLNGLNGRSPSTITLPDDMTGITFDTTYVFRMPGDTNFHVTRLHSICNLEDL